MPTYEYECTKCGIHFEQFQSMVDEPLKTCPECQGAVHRLIGMGAGIIFKGSGFYETDYKKKIPPKSEELKTQSTKGSSSGKTESTSQQENAK